MRCSARSLLYAALLCVGIASALTSGCLLRLPAP
jgi:hypothetical protein